MSTSTKAEKMREQLAALGGLTLDELEARDEEIRLEIVNLMERRSPIRSLIHEHRRAIGVTQREERLQEKARRRKIEELKDTTSEDKIRAVPPIDEL